MKKPGYIISAIGIMPNGKTYFFRGLGHGQGGTPEPSTYYTEDLDSLLVWIKANLKHFDEYYKDLIKQKESDEK